MNEVIESYTVFNWIEVIGFGMALIVMFAITQACLEQWRSNR